MGERDAADGNRVYCSPSTTTQHHLEMRTIEIRDASCPALFLVQGCPLYNVTSSNNNLYCRYYYTVLECLSSCGGITFFRWNVSVFLDT